MIRVLSTILALVLMVSAGTAAATDRAIWTWEQATFGMVQDRGAGDSAIAFLRSKRIRTIYLYADFYRGENLGGPQAALYRLFVQRLHRGGLRVYALLGSAYLHTEEYVLPEHREDALAMFRQVLAYNAAAKPGERFDGVNLDIEPHVLDQWAEHKRELLGQFLDLGQALMELKRTSGQSLEVGPAIPFWYDGIALEWHGHTKPASEHVLDVYDYIALMDYRDHAEGPDGIISNGIEELKYAQRLHKKLIVGVDVAPNEVQKVSFDHLAEQDLERELALAERVFRGYRAFSGFAIHHFDGYQQWLARLSDPPAPRP